MQPVVVRKDGDLELFLRNLLLGENNELKNRYIHVRWQKQDIEEQKQNIESPKQDIEIPEAFSTKTKQHIQILFADIKCCSKCWR